MIVSNCNARKGMNPTVPSLLAGVLLLHSFGAVADESVRYYCPRGNAQLNGNDHHLTGVAVTPYPLQLGSEIERSKTLYYELSNCSDGRFLCLEARRPDDDGVLRIFAPRLIEPGATYHLGPATAVAIGSTSGSTHARAQLVIRQDLSGEVVTFKITLEEQRGIVFFDGVDFWRSGRLSSSGETCVLESSLGYFSEVKISASPPARSE